MSGELDRAKPTQGQEAKGKPQTSDFQAAPGEAEADGVQAAFLAGGAGAPNPPPASDKESPYAHPTAQSLRQSAILQMQQTVGNHYVARMLARSEASGGSEAPETKAKAKDDPVVVQSQLGRGQPLDTQVKSSMEEAFGQDFSQVQTHTDAPAARLSTGLNARAFAVGNHVAFADGEYQPGTPTGDALIAHELAHVTQQQGATGHQAGVMKKGEGESSAAEADADRRHGREGEPRGVVMDRGEIRDGRGDRAGLGAGDRAEAINLCGGRGRRARDHERAEDGEGAQQRGWPTLPQGAEC